MTVIGWVLAVPAIIALVAGGGLLALSGRGDLPFEVPRPAGITVLGVAAALLLVLLIGRLAS
ncbi:hypothetical protein [Curtobacterium sp. L1-20]|uniref:hypothetical protein n=1 Tax=Curtobacterium sp. L1-20 TaxID=3138181 RepID=UPI003B521F18